MDARELDALKRWIGKTETVHDHVTASGMQRVHALLDHEVSLSQTGTAVPRGWHSVMCPPIVRQSDLGEEGHPKRGTFIPPISFSRRMVASVTMDIIDDLVIDDEVRRESVIENIFLKQGRTGTILFLNQKNEFYSPRGLAVTERQTFSFRDIPARWVTSAKGEARSETPLWERIVTADPVLVFRYAAITYAGHRIHYDQPYAQEVEKHADVVVSGGLSLLLLLDLIHANLPGRLTKFSSRNLRPAYVNEHLRVCGCRMTVDRQFRLWIEDQTGSMTVDASAELDAESPIS
jgi:3-methylfumaryl-CoA hydratase